MPFSATVLQVLIASPSDVPEARSAIAATLYDWNALHAQTMGYVLLPVMWESHSAPAMGDRPQAIINKQVVRNCDMLVGAFWTRLGSPTGVEDSGTVEEIRYFLNLNKPVMLYYSKQQVDLDRIDTKQLEKLKEFKASIRDKGIQEDFTSTDDLKQRLFRHLTIVLRDMTVSPMVDERVVRAAHESTRGDLGADTPPTVPAKKKSPKDGEEGIWLEEYSDKSFVVRGNSLEFAAKLKEIGGRWMSLRNGGKGWMFSKRWLDDVAKLLKQKPKLRPQSE